MGDLLKRFSSDNGAASQSGNQGSLKGRMAEKLGDMKAGAQIQASKDMFVVARDSTEQMGSALNAQKSEKGVRGNGTYMYKTDALIKMLDGLVGKFDAEAPGKNSRAAKNTSAAVLSTIRNQALQSGNFKKGVQEAVQAQVEEFSSKNPSKGGGGSIEAAFGGRELKILHEVLSTLGTRMSVDGADKFGLSKNRPTERDQSDRSVGNRSTVQEGDKLAATRESHEIDQARNSRVYHARLGNVVKNMGGALKDKARSTGAALRNYTEPARREVAIGGLAAAKGTLQAAEQIREGLDEAQAHVVGGTWGTLKGVTLAAAKAGSDLGKSAARTAANIAQGTADVLAHGANTAKETHGAQVAKAKARKSSGKTQAPAPAAVASVGRSRSPAQTPQVTRAPSVRSVSPSIGGQPDAATGRPASSRRASVSSTSTEGSFRTANDTESEEENS